MNDRENDTMRENEGRQVQQELENQLRAFGDTVSDAFAHGFEGKGEDIGDRAYGVGRAAVNAANYGIGEAAKAFRQGRTPDRAKQSSNRGSADAAGMTDWFRQIFAKPEPTPVESIRISAKKRYSAGCTLLAVGITFAATFGIVGISCLGVAAAATPIWVQDVAQYVVGGELLTEAAMTALEFCGGIFTLLACGFGVMISAGASRLKASKTLLRLAETAEGFDCKKGLPLEAVDEKKARALKRVRRFIRNGWLSAWVDEKAEKLYLTAEDYRAAQEAAAASKAPPQPEPTAEKTDDVPLNLETARRFAAVLQQEKQLMQDAQGREELDHMQTTTTAICDWLEAHPESLPKARRFAEYYIPTTLKLLHTYNDVQGQQGENAETIRRDIAGILHTLNQAYDTLYDTLLSDVAMDVSSEIAALQGMLANDGLTGGNFE